MPFNNIPHPEMVTKSNEVRRVLTRDLYAYLISLLPTPESFGELQDSFSDNFAGSLKGDPEKIKACEADRDKLNQDLAMIVGLGKTVSIKDPTVLETLKLQHLVAEKTTYSLIPLDVTKDFRIIFDKKGRPFASFTKLAGARAYEIWVCDGDPSIESNWKLLVWETKCQRIALPGLNRAKTNFLKVRGKRGEETGPWSNFISLDPA